MAFGAAPAWICAPDQGDRTANVDPPVDDGGDADSNLGQREHQVLGQVRARGMPASAVELNPDGVRGGGDGADPGADQSDVDPGVAVQRQDRGRPFRTPCSITASAPPGMVSSAGWKITRTPGGNSPSRSSLRRTSATPSITVVWISCPQAWLSRYGPRRTPGRFPPGSAAHRYPRAGRWPAGLRRRPQKRPVPSSSCGSNPAAVNRAASLSVVRNSLCDSSGCWCRSRRKSPRAHPAAAMPRRRYEIGRRVSEIFCTLALSDCAPASEDVRGTTGVST